MDDGTMRVICLVAKDLWTGEVTSRFGDELGQKAPFPTGPNSLVVAYFAAAEIEAFWALGWDLPVNVIDLYAEHMRLTNGLPTTEMHGVPSGTRGSLLAALRCHGLPAREHESKRRAIRKILAGPPFDAATRKEILDYCQESERDTRYCSGIDDEGLHVRPTRKYQRLFEPRKASGGAKLMLRRACSPVVVMGFAAIRPSNVIRISAFQDAKRKGLGFASCWTCVKDDVVAARPIAEPPDIIQVFSETTAQTQERVPVPRHGAGTFAFVVGHVFGLSCSFRTTWHPPSFGLLVLGWALL